MTVFISGPISGEPTYKKNFEDAAALIERKLGKCAVLNPSALPQGLSEEEYMRICLAMLDAADLALFLPRWKSSKGSLVERAYCDKTDIVCVELAEVEKWGDV